MYAGYAVPVTSMLGWSRWINYIDPVAYAFEAMMINEYSGRDYACSQFVPPYPDASGVNRVCNAVGARPGNVDVSGTAFIESAYGYDPAHKWRNIGIIIAFMFGLLLVHLITTGESSSARSPRQN